MSSIINHIDNIRAKINEIAGSVIEIELKMRALAESDPLFKQALDKQIKNSKDAKNANRNQYWNCSLKMLCDSIIIYFDHKLTKQEKQLIMFFKEPRNKIAHGDLVGLMLTLNITPEGQEIYSNGKRNILKAGNIHQAIIRFDTNNTINVLRQCYNNMNVILNKLLN